MNIQYFIKKIIEYKKYESNTAQYFIGYDLIRIKKSKLQVFKDFIVCNLFCKPEITEILIDIFCEIQKIRFAFNRLIHFWKFKKAKRLPHELDLCLIPMSSYPPHQKVQIIHQETLYTFRISDIINMWKKALTNNNDLFPAPKNLKNPFTNLPFQENNMYNLYFALINSNYHIPFTITGFF